MSITGNIIGMPPGAGGSFPMAGTRPKVRKSITIVASPTASTIYQWVAPPNVYFAILSMCGGGGGGSTGRAETTTGGTIGNFFYGGGGGASVAPSIIPINPGSVYTLVAGKGAEPVVANPTASGVISGFTGTASLFYGDTFSLIASGGRGGTSVGGGTGGAMITGSSAVYNITYLPGGSGSSQQVISTYHFNGVIGDGILITGQTPTSSLQTVDDFTNGPGGGVVVSISTPGGNSLYGTGSNGRARESPTASLAGFGGGGGAAIGFSKTIDSIGTITYPLLGNGTGSAGGPGMVRLIWEE